MPSMSSMPLNCTGLDKTALHCTLLHCSVPHCSVPHCPALHCTVLHWTVLHCTAVQWKSALAERTGSSRIKWRTRRIRRNSQTSLKDLISDLLFSIIIFIYVMIVFLYMFYAFCWREERTEEGRKEERRNCQEPEDDEVWLKQCQMYYGC